MTSRDSERRSVLSHGGEEREEAAARAAMQALELARGKGLLPSPTELSLRAAKPCTTLAPLRWHHWGTVPHKMRLTNTGCTVMVSAKWREKVRPHLTGGPLLGRYVFSQLHFHWGQEDNEGSEHTLDGGSFPLEMHMVLFKSRYLTQEAALKEMDGVVEVAYVFELSKKDNPQLDAMVQTLAKVHCAMNSSRFGPVALTELVPCFATDYLLYMGSLLTGKCAHALTWIVRYQPLPISKRQMEAMRSVLGLDGNPLLRNWRKAHPPLGRTVLHVVPPGHRLSRRAVSLSEGQTGEKRQTRFSPDRAQNDESKGASDEEGGSPKGRRRFFGFLGKKSQGAPEVGAPLPTVDSSGDSEAAAGPSSRQSWLPRIAGLPSQCQREDLDSAFIAMCEDGYSQSSSSSLHSSTAGEDMHDSAPEAAAAGDAESRRQVTEAATRKPIDMGVMLLEPPQLRRGVGAAFFRPYGRRRSVGVTFLDRRIRPFNPLLSEVEEESDRTSETVADATDGEGTCDGVAAEKSGLLDSPLLPAKSPSYTLGEKQELSSIKDDTGENGDDRLSVELSSCLPIVPLSPSDSPSSPSGEDTETPLLPAINEHSPQTVEGNDERDRVVTSDACKLTVPTKGVEGFSPVMSTFHRYWKGGISWWVPYEDKHASDDNSNNTEKPSLDTLLRYADDKFSSLEKAITDNFFKVLEEEIFTDTSAATDTTQTENSVGQRGTDLFSDSTVNLSSKESTVKHSSEEQDAIATIWRSPIADVAFNDMNNSHRPDLSAHKDTCIKNVIGCPGSETPPSDFNPNATTTVSVYPDDKQETTDSDVSYGWSNRNRTQKRSVEEELRFPEIRIPKRMNDKPKIQKKRTCLSMITLHDIQENNNSHNMFQRTTKDGKVKDRLSSWREMQSRKRSSRKTENKKQNRSKRRHRSSSSMEHFVLDSSSEDRSTLEKKASKKFKLPSVTKPNDTQIADDKFTKDVYDLWRRDGSNSSSSVSSHFSSKGAKCIDKVVETGGKQELMGSGNEMKLQEISFHYAPSGAGETPRNRKHLITAADHGDNEINKSPSKLRLSLKAPVDMSQLLKKLPSATSITIDCQDREVTVGMVLVDSPRCEEGKETNSFRCEEGRGTNSASAQDVTSVMAAQTDQEEPENAPVDDSEDLSTSVVIQNCTTEELTSARQFSPAVDNAETHQMETSEPTMSNLTANIGHSPHRDRPCNTDCWICQLSTIKVIQYTQGLENCGDLSTSAKSENNDIRTPSAVKFGIENEVMAPVQVPSEKDVTCSHNSVKPVSSQDDIMITGNVSTGNNVGYTPNVEGPVSNEDEVMGPAHVPNGVTCTPKSVKPVSSEDEIMAHVNDPSNTLQRISSVYSRTPPFFEWSGRNERIPVPEPTPIGDVPLQGNHMEGAALPSSQNSNGIFESVETRSTNSKIYRTTMELRLFRDGTISGNSSSNSNGCERLNQSIETTKEIVSAQQKMSQMRVCVTNSICCEETEKSLPLPIVNDENKGHGAATEPTEVIDIYRKNKLRPQRKHIFSLDRIHETSTMHSINSYSSCATGSDVSLIPDEDEAVSEASNIRLLVSENEIPTRQNQGTRCTEMSDNGGTEFLSNSDRKSTLRRFSLEYDTLSKVLLYTTLRQLAMRSMAVGRPAVVQDYPENKNCANNESNDFRDPLQLSPGMDVVRNPSKVQYNQYDETGSKSTRTGREELNTTSPECSAPPQAVLVDPETEWRREIDATRERQQLVSDAGGGIVETKFSDSQLLSVASKTKKNSSTLHDKDSVCIGDGKPSNIEENTCNEREPESVADSQDPRYVEELEFSSASVSSITTKSERKSKTKARRPASVQGSVEGSVQGSARGSVESCAHGSVHGSVQGSVKHQKLCSVEVRNKVHHPGGEPQPGRRPKSVRAQDRILSPREVYERRKMYAKNLALRRAQKASHHDGSEDGETRSNFDENQSTAEEKSARERSRKELRSINTTCGDDHHSVGSGTRRETGNKSASASKDTTLGNVRDTTNQTQREKKFRVAAGASEHLNVRNGGSSCSTCSTKNNTVSSSGKDRTAASSRSLRGEMKLPGPRERSMRANIAGHRREYPAKEADKASPCIGRSSASSEQSGGPSGSRRIPATVASSAANSRKPAEKQGHELKNNTAKDCSISAPTPRTEPCLTQKRSEKDLERKASSIESVELDFIEVLDKPSFCESWVQQHYSDSTLGSLCCSSSAETTVETVIPSPTKTDAELKVSGNAVAKSEKSLTVYESCEGRNTEVSGGPESEESTLSDLEAFLTSRKRKVSGEMSGQQMPLSGGTNMLMLPYRTGNVPLLTYKPQKLSSDELKSLHSDHDLESHSAKITPPPVDLLPTVAADLPLSPTDIDGARKKAKRGKFDEKKQRDRFTPEVNDSTGGRNESRELQKASSHGNKTPTTQSPTPPPSIPEKKTVATSPILLRKQNVLLQDGQQMSWTVETFSFCSTGVNTSLSVTRLSSRSLGVQCPSRGISQQPSSTTGIIQSIVGAEGPPETRVHAATGMHAMLTEVATRLENQLLVQKSVATQWLRRASVPNLALRSTGKKAKKTGKRRKRSSSNNSCRQAVAAPASPLADYDLGVNEAQMENVRFQHRRRLFRAFSTNSLALGTNEAGMKKVLRRLFRRKKKKKGKSDGTEDKSKGHKNHKKKKDAQQATTIATSSGSGGSPSPTPAASGAVARRAGDNSATATEAEAAATTYRSAVSSPTHCGDLSDAPTGSERKHRKHKLKDADQKHSSQRLLLVRGSESAQSPALFEDLEGAPATADEVAAAASGSNWCSVHQRPVPVGDSDGAMPTQGGAEADAEEVSTAVAQVNSGAHVLRVSLADEASPGCSDLGSMEFVVGGSESARPPNPNTSVLARLRHMLTWRS